MLVSPEEEIVDFKLTGRFLYILEKTKFSLYERQAQLVNLVWTQPIKKKILGSTLTDNGNLIIW